MAGYEELMGSPMDVRNHPSNNISDPITPDIPYAFNTLKEDQNRMQQQDNPIMHSRLGSNPTYDRKKKR